MTSNCWNSFKTDHFPGKTFSFKSAVSKIVFQSATLKSAMKPWNAGRSDNLAISDQDLSEIVAGSGLEKVVDPSPTPPVVKWENS